MPPRTNNSLPIPGVVYNPSFPPKNPPVGTGLFRPVVPVVRPDTNSITGGSDKDEDENDLHGPNTHIPNRFGGDDDEEDRFVFDVEERTTKRPASQSPTQSRKAHNP